MAVSTLLVLSGHILATLATDYCHITPQHTMCQYKVYQTWKPN